jgi:hypothetical protein
MGDDFSGHTALLDIDAMFAATGNYSNVPLKKNSTSTSTSTVTADTTSHNMMSLLADELAMDAYGETPTKGSDTSKSTQPKAKPRPLQERSVPKLPASAPPAAVQAASQARGQPQPSAKRPRPVIDDEEDDDEDLELDMDALVRKSTAWSLSAFQSSSPLRLSGDSDTTACIGGLFQDQTTNVTRGIEDATGDVTRMFMVEARARSQQQQAKAQSIDFYCDDDADGEAIHDSPVAPARKGGLSARPALQPASHAPRQSVTGNLMNSRRSLVTRKSFRPTGSGSGAKQMSDEEYDRENELQHAKFMAEMAQDGALFGGGDFDDDGFSINPPGFGSAPTAPKSTSTSAPAPASASSSSHASKPTQGLSSRISDENHDARPPASASASAAPKRKGLGLRPQSDDAPAPA